MIWPSAPRAVDRSLPAERFAAAQPSGMRQVRFGGGWFDTPIYDQSFSRITAALPEVNALPADVNSNITLMPAVLASGCSDPIRAAADCAARSVRANGERSQRLIAIILVMLLSSFVSRARQRNDLSLKTRKPG